MQAGPIHRDAYRRMAPGDAPLSCWLVEISGAEQRKARAGGNEET